MSLMTLPGASLTVSLGAPIEGLPQVHVLGNREGMLSLANVLLWLNARGFEREFMPITALPFVHREGTLALSVRLKGECCGNRPLDFGKLHLLDKASQYEWRLGDVELVRLAVAIHRLACFPEHGYDVFPIEEPGDAWVRIELLSNWEAVRERNRKGKSS